MSAASAANAGMPPPPLPVVLGAAAARATIFRKRVVDAGALSDAERDLIATLYPGADVTTADAAVRRIIDEVRGDGDRALRRISAALDGFAPDPIRVGEAEFAAARAAVDDGLIGALQAAAERVRDYHQRQLAHAMQSFEHDGLGQIVRPIARVGLYVPGTAVVYPSSVLHTAIPALVAGVEDVCIVSPGVAGGRGAGRRQGKRRRRPDQAGRRRDRRRDDRLQGRGGAGDRGARLRHRVGARRRQDLRARQSLRDAGQAHGLRRCGDRCALRADGDRRRDG